MTENCDVLSSENNVDILNSRKDNTNGEQMSSHPSNDDGGGVVVVDTPPAFSCGGVRQSSQASLPPDQQGHHSLGRHPEVQYIA